MANESGRHSARPPTEPDTDSASGAQHESLLRLANDLLAAADSHTAATAVLDAVLEMYQFPRGVLLGAPDARLPVLASYGLAEPTTPAGQGRSAAVMTALDQKETTVVRRLDASDEPWLAQLFPVGADLLIVPMSIPTPDGEDRRYGALLVQTPSPPEQGWRRIVIESLERVTAAAARALRTLWRMEHLERLAATDELTMIANRRTFNASLERELNRGARSGEPVSLVILDLDDFKTVNDIHGHPAGDEALRNVAAALSIACRDLDTAARYGGEEFAVILPDCGPDRCLDIAERLRHAVASAPAVRPLTASAGVASYPAHASDSESLVRAADDALLLSKRAGRDRTTLARKVSADERRLAVAQRLTAQGRLPADRRPSAGL
ncbi:MAG: GGDEF domain-containing protein [Actinobacteria bacterium]|nr:GGDEF domain-containing protein [Actinomycetota bacterium]